MKPVACIVVFCNRTTRDVICGRCWRFVSPETKLSLEDAGRLWRAANAAKDDLAEFLSFSYWTTMRAAAAEAYATREEREEERYQARIAAMYGRAEPDVVMSARERRGTRARP